MGDSTETRDQADFERQALAAYLAGHEADSIDDPDARAQPVGRPRATRGRPRGPRSGSRSRSSAPASRALVSGWAARARRLLDEDRHDCVECGYVMLPQALEQVAAGDLAGAESTFAAAERIGERFQDPDLDQPRAPGPRPRAGRPRPRRGGRRALRRSDGGGDRRRSDADRLRRRLLQRDFRVLRDARHPPRAGVDRRAERLVRVAAATSCRTAASAWRTAPRSSACAASGRRRSTRRSAPASACRRPGASRRAPAFYELAELHRLRGLAAEAEEAYRLAGEYGRSPHPGLALLRLAQGQPDAARAAIDARAGRAAAGDGSAPTLMAAAIEILLACDDAPAARRVADELKTLAGRDRHADGCGPSRRRPTAPCASRRETRGRRSRRCGRRWTIWRDLDAPYEAARVDGARPPRLPCARRRRRRADGAGTPPSASSASSAPRRTWLAVDGREAEPPPAVPSGGLTSREVEVLRLVARGKTNRAIAARARHQRKDRRPPLSNIFTKLDLSSRAAATAYAFTHRLVD